MAFKMFSTGLLLALVGMCLCQHPQSINISPSQYQSGVSQASYNTGSTSNQQSSQIKLEDIERDSLVADFRQKSQQPNSKSAPIGLQSQTYQNAAQSQLYYMQPYQSQQQFYVQPYQAQPYQMAFDYAGVQYMIVPTTYSNNQVYQPYYTSSVPQPSAVPQYVTKQSSSSTAHSQSQPDYKPQVAASAQTQQEYKTQYVASAPAYQYVQQPSASAIASPVDYSYITRHPSFKVPAVSPVAIQPQHQYTAAPQQNPQYQQPQYQQPQYQQPQYQQPQYYHSLPAQTAVVAEQPRVQQSLKSQYSSGVKSTTPFPLQKEAFSYKFESSPLIQQQQSSATYSTLKYSA